MPSQWREEQGPHGAKRWVNLRTGRIQYRDPGSAHPVFRQKQEMKRKLRENNENNQRKLREYDEKQKQPKQEEKPDLFEAGLQSSDLTTRMRTQYGQFAKDLHERLPAAAKERFTKHVKSVSFHESPEVLTEKVIEGNPAMKEVMKGGKKAAGAYSKKNEALHLNGGFTMDGKKLTADHIYAHEFAHAIDGPDLELSKDEGWREAWRSEAQLVSKYALKTPQEGFAEFGRLVYAGGLSADQMTERFPMMFKHWEGAGLLPDGMQSTNDLAEGNEPQMPDVLEEPFYSPDLIGDRPLSRRGSDEGLKDYLRGVGGEGAHDTIKDYAKQLHEQSKQETTLHNSAVKMGFDTLSQYAGKSITAKHEAFKTGDLDQLPRFYEVATAVASEHPGLLSEDNAAEDLYERMKEGIKPSPVMREFEDQATQEWHDNGRPMPEGYEPPVVDDSFDFGGNVEAEKHPWKSTPEEDAEAWAKFNAKASVKGSGLTFPTQETKKQEPSPMPKEEDRDTEEILRRKFAAEAARTKPK